MTFVAGAYTATYNAKALGQTADGFRLSHQFFKRLIQGDSGGQTAQDAVYQGVDVNVAYTLIQALAAGVDDLKWPYSGTVGTPLDLGVVGQLDVCGAGGGSPTAVAKPLVLTAVSGTAADTDGPATITLPLSILAEGFPVELLFAPDLREVPIRQRIYPNMSTRLFGTEA